MLEGTRHDKIRVNQIRNGSTGIADLFKNNILYDRLTNRQNEFDDIEAVFVERLIKTQNRDVSGFLWLYGNTVLHVFGRSGRRFWRWAHQPAALSSAAVSSVVFSSVGLSTVAAFLLRETPLSVT